MSLSLYLDCCALQRPFDDRSQLRVATEAEAVLKLIELFEDGDLTLFSSGALLFEVGRIRLLKRRDYCLDLLGRCSDFINFTETIRERAVPKPTAKKVSSQWMLNTWLLQSSARQIIFAVVMIVF